MRRKTLPMNKKYQKLFSWSFQDHQKKTRYQHQGWIWGDVSSLLRVSTHCRPKSSPCYYFRISNLADRYLNFSAPIYIFYAIFWPKKTGFWLVFFSKKMPAAQNGVFIGRWDQFVRPYKKVTKFSNQHPPIILKMRTQNM